MFFFEKTVRGEPSPLTPASSWSSELPVFLNLVHWQAAGIYVLSFWVVKHSLSGALKWGHFLSKCVLGPGNMSPWRCAPRRRMSWSHVWEMLRPSFPSWILWCPLGCQKCWKILQGRHMFYFFKSSVSANHLTVGQPSHHKKSWLPPPLLLLVCSFPSVE